VFSVRYKLNLKSKTPNYFIKLLLKDYHVFVIVLSHYQWNNKTNKISIT